MRRPENHVVVLFGGRGDLARRKLLPGLFHLAEAGLMPESFRIIGTSRRGMDDDDYRALTREALQEFGGGAPPHEAAWKAFAPTLSYARSAAGDAGELVAAVARAEEAIGGAPRRLHYLSVPPGASAGIARTLGETGLAERGRVILEKPFGHDLDSARELNALLHELFEESQVFRIDHFLGKEAVQNLLAMRFANGMFEPVWNKQHIDHVQIDVPEKLGVEGRADFYEETGAYRDMIVTHLFHLLGFVAMEPPTSLMSGPLNDEQTKVFRSMEPISPEDVVRGQYRGYREEEGVAADSDTETFVALRAHIENWRWSGVPFYLRTGKEMATKAQRLTIAFREPPRRMFPLPPALQGSDRLVFDLGDPGGIAADFWAKRPGPTMLLGRGRMRFSFEETFGTEGLLEAYERLIHDALLGDHTLFTRADGIERTWELSSPVFAYPPPIELYEPGSWGPEGALGELIAPRRWALPE
jgi:glucose-6-phosphate 1-dehydrogenase